MMQVQALLNGSSSSLSGMQGGSHSNLASMSGRGMAPNGSPHRSGSGGGLDPPSALLSAGSQHLSASQLLSLVISCPYIQALWQREQANSCSLHAYIAIKHV